MTQISQGAAEKTVKLEAAGPENGYRYTVAIVRTSTYGIGRLSFHTPDTSMGQDVPIEGLRDLRDAITAVLVVHDDQAEAKRVADLAKTALIVAADLLEAAA